MDWNKSNTILIIAFIILNIFLFTSSYNDIFSEDYNVNSDAKFIENLKEVLSEKNITISRELPQETYILPMLETEYEIININNELLERFLGAGIEPIADVTIYNNDKGEELEIKDGKKLCYTVREKVSGKIDSLDKIDNYINQFIKEKSINREDYNESFRYISDDGAIVNFTKSYNNFSIDNSYMSFHIDKNGIYKFEMQNIVVIKEIADKIRTFSAAEALPRIMTYNDIENKEITDIVMTYYSDEAENWQFILGINSYPVWKVIFSDGTYKHLTNINFQKID